ncbi:hypothetical protein EJ05DRAFT_499690 [Pseudovirgaria hyperparasitica]|uniref:Uncharacterized protein n=1 Tax=Pseudovirgaria hyperparasitica TaxID=470096 RepID=A0A6A6WBR2_9PEZI|nr:uncharacterized protein EJ05DRAFT_499690 [Pseudovirgaria hyperparasitica]KAF2759276.1 hypothetical protein EJ05DRAFT_499690 [Pseudovirgaria hyperparasitica]
MSARRKRSSSSPERDARQVGFSASTPGAEQPKRNKVTSEVDEVELIAPSDAWTVDTSTIFSPKENRGIRIICIVEKLRVHYDIDVLPTYIGSCALVKDPAHSILGNGEHQIPLKPGLGSDFNHFLKLGVLQPMGGGQAPLDSIIVIDAHDRRRLLVPFGWGAGRHVMDATGGKVIIERMTRTLIHALGDLLQSK